MRLANDEVNAARAERDAACVRAQSAEMGAREAAMAAEAMEAKMRVSAQHVHMTCSQGTWGPWLRARAGAYARVVEEANAWPVCVRVRRRAYEWRRKRR